jgi:hypothetical protein
MGTLEQRRPASRKPGRDDRGGILVEFGLVVPIFVMVILGAVTTGLGYNTNNSLNNGAREADRYGATLDIDGDLHTWLGLVADAAVLSTSGEISEGVESREICVAYVHPEGTAPTDSTTALLRDGAGEVIASGATCFDDGRASSERRVQVLLGRDAEIQAVVFETSIGLEATAVVRYERSS